MGCPAERPICLPNEGRCVECIAGGTQCAAKNGSPFCSPGGTCVPCLDGADCDDGNPCTADQCSGQPDKVECVNPPLPTGTRIDAMGCYCNDASACVACTENAHCTDANPCSVDACVGGNCQNVINGDCTGCSVDADCGDCGTCSAGTCRPAADGTACGATLDCTQRIHGTSYLSCYAGAGTPRGTCSAGTCVAATMAQCTRGAVLGTCGSTECMDTSNCTAGTLRTAFVSTEFCRTSGQTPQCQGFTRCVDSTWYGLACSVQGACTAEEPAFECGNFRCDVDMTNGPCFLGCNGPQQCSLTATCSNGTCFTNQ